MAVTAAAALVVPVWAGPAAAETSSEAPSSAAYFSSAGLTQPPGAEAAPAPPPLVNEVDGVGPNNLAVAAQGEREDKVSFLYFSLSEVPSGATVDKAVLTVPLVPSDNANVTFGIDDPGVVSACKILGSGFSSEEGTALSLAPERDCPTFAAKAAREGEALVFDITALAASWAEVNDGLALTRTLGNSGAFQAVLSRDATLAVDFTAPPAEDTTPPADAGTATTDLGAGTADLGGGFSGGTSDLGSSPVSSDLGGGFDSASAPLATPSLPDAALAPETTGADPVVAAPVSSPTGLAASSSPTAGFWLAALLLAGGLVLLSLIMGDPRSVVSAQASPSRLTQALSARQRGSGTASLNPRSL